MDSNALKASLGIVLMEPTDWRNKFHTYLEREVEENFKGFPERCFRGGEFRVQKDVLNALYGYYVALKQKVRELGLDRTSAKASPRNRTLIKSCQTIQGCLKLLITTYMMTRNLTLVESTRQQVHDQLQCRPIETFGVHTASRVLNKELKYIIAPLHQKMFKDLLDQVQNTLLVSSGDKLPSWATLLGSLLTMAVNMESVQVNLRCKEATDKCHKIIPEDSDAATMDLERMEEKWNILVSLFCQAYSRLDPIQKEDNRARLDPPSRELARRFQIIIENHRKSPSAFADHQ